MVQRILVLVIILVLTTFLFFILHINRKYHEGMRFNKINGVVITKDTSNDVLEDLKVQAIHSIAKFEKKIQECNNDIVNNNQAKGGLMKLKRAYKEEIENNQKIIDADTIAIETADANNQIFTAENEILEKNIDNLFEKISKLTSEREIIEKSNPKSRKGIREKGRKIQVNQNNNNRAKTKIENKNAKILFNDEQIVDITIFQTRIETLLTRELELENLLKGNREQMAGYTNLNHELKDQITFYKSKIKKVKRDIIYLDAALQDLTSRTTNPNNASGVVSSISNGA